MDNVGKENGIQEPLLPSLLKQQNQSQKDGRRVRRCRSAPASNLNMQGSTQKDRHPELPVKTRNNRPTLIQAGLILCIYLAVGMICFYNVQHELKGLKTSRMVDALYFCIVTMTTVGYGDLVPNGILAKLLACVFVFSGMALVGLLLGGAADYLVEKQERLLIKAVSRNQNHVLEDCTSEKMVHRAHCKLLVSLAILLALILVGVVFLYEFEGLDFLDSFYCVCSTITTLGYGDQSFSTEGGRIFAIVWILVSTICLAQFYLYVAEARTEDRQQALVNWVLTRRTTATDLEAADLDSDGVVSASEFVIYKLKEMGKIEDEDVAPLMKEFEDLDVDHSGTLTKTDLNLAQQAPEN
uniref:TSA: Wollemia nobilis Ref_Wollemi_Transcript_124_1609 transcribed RNA sequence n=1 Tax=Wollemia nobilis TaxID=56998 RepID=A0A0C9RZF8_9CONI